MDAVDELQTAELDINKLFEGYCVLVFQFSDGSILKSLTTLKLDILEMHGLAGEDSLMDLEERRPIPEYVLAYLKEIQPGKNTQVTGLNKYFALGGKLSW